MVLPRPKIRAAEFMAPDPSTTPKPSMPRVRNPTAARRASSTSSSGSVGAIITNPCGSNTVGIANLSDILKKVPGVGVVLIGEGDLSQELGYPRQYEHPKVVEAMAEIVRVCKENNVPVGHPHVGSANVERILGEGYRWLMAAPVRSYAALEKGRQLTGRT